MKKILVTGATGFVGTALCSRLLREGLQVTGAMRTELNSSALLAGVTASVVGSIGPATTWTSALMGVDAVVHLAARTHVMRENADDPLQACRLINVAGTERLAREAAASRVKRFIYLSSVKVNGEGRDEPYTELDAPFPEDAYGISKWEAERVLHRIDKETGMEVVIIRPPLVYGPGVKGNFASMIQWVAKGVPLPLGAVRGNRRSLVALDNLVDLIVTCIRHPAAANEVFLAGDGEDLSTAELVRRVAKAVSKPARLVPVPVWLLKSAASMLGKRDVAQRLLGSLQVDISKARRLLDWTPPVSVDEGLRRAVEPLLHGQSQKQRGHRRMMRFFDMLFSFLGLLAALPVLVVLAVIGLFDTGSPLFRQVRVGRHQKPFTLVKFRTMKPGTASVATHLASAEDVTPVGRFLRRTKLDELPQLWNVLRGEMSLVGPRPCLLDQTELIEERARRGVFDARPGVTGLAQINGVDMSTPRLLAETDERMLANLTLGDYFLYIFQTLTGKGLADRIRT